MLSIQKVAMTNLFKIMKKLEAHHSEKLTEVQAAIFV